MSGIRGRFAERSQASVLQTNQAPEPRGPAILIDGTVSCEIVALACDAKMYHMMKASIRDLRYGFRKIERLLRQGEAIQITNRRRVVARLIPETAEPEFPDFLKRLQAIYGDKVLAVTGADLIAEERSRY